MLPGSTGKRYLRAEALLFSFGILILILASMERSSVKLDIRKSGLLTLVQDKGRNGHQAYGLPLGGALDRRAAVAANYLLGQAAEAPLLEITLQGPEICFGGDLQIALTGADLNPVLDGKPIALYQTLAVRAGQVLAFGRARSGCRAYLAIRGRWQMPDWLGSYSGMKIGAQYWPAGSRLEAGMEISIVPDTFLEPRRIPPQDRAFHSRQLSVRVMAGPEFAWFSRASVEYFTSHAFRISPDSNRMGYRLRESLPDFRPDRELISSGIVPGTVQVLPSGSPVILLADAQTTGGYPRIANVLDRDLDYLAQLVPGDQVRFLLRW
jgi:antagonist of KipI